jgi:uncharacterized protein HemX
MPSFSEMNSKVTVSIGLILFIIGATFAVTSFYLKQVTLEDRMDKRNERVLEEIQRIDSEHKKELEHIEERVTERIDRNEKRLDEQIEKSDNHIEEVSGQ